MMVSYARAQIRAREGSSNLSQLTDLSTSGGMKAHACCKARHRGAKQSARRSLPAEASEALALPEDSAPAGTMNCCPLTSGSIVIVSHRDSHDDAAAIAQKDAHPINPLRLDAKQVEAPLRLPNRARSYLLDCAFLI